MNDNAVMPIFILGLIFGLGFGIWGATTWTRAQAVERGYALHCPTTGDFAWKGECK